MKVTFPHMGNIYIFIKTLFDTLGVDYVIPPRSGKKSLELGSKYTPEMACIPLKINMGNFLEGIELGADTIVITGGCGPCRFGYYGEMHREILADMGKNVEVIIIELTDEGVGELIARLRKLFPDKSLAAIMGGFYSGLRAIVMVDKLEKHGYYVRPREIDKGATDKIMKKFESDILKVKGKRAIYRLIRDTDKRLSDIEIDNSFVPLKVGIVGEIYTLIEPLTNINVDRILGNMGIEVDFSLTLSGWIIEHIIKGGLKLPRKMDFAKAAYPYIKTMIGGHAQETVGNTVLYSRRGFDGVIEIYPLTCMPEIVANSILPAVSRDFDMPVLTLVMDEITGEAGYRTRIDAFADMLKRKREKRKDEFVLSGS